MNKIDNPFKGLRLPVIAAPMFLVSGPEMLLACCNRGVVGTFPALNHRTTEGFNQWLTDIETGLKSTSGTSAFGVNLIVHKTNPRLEDDLAVCVEHKVPLVITSLGAVAELVDKVHSYGGLVFHDVINLRHAQKAMDAGVDGLITVAAGAGGHAGTLSPFALVNEIRKLFDGYVALSGCLSTGRDIAAAQMMGADFAYMGTRFINTRESLAVEGYKKMIASANAADIVYTDKVSGVYANFLGESLKQAGMLSEQASTAKKAIDFGEELQPPADGEAGAWKDIWSAGQGVGSIDTVPPSVTELVDQLSAEYHEACAQHHKQSADFAV